MGLAAVHGVLCVRCVSEGNAQYLEQCFVCHKQKTLHLEEGIGFPTKVALEA